MIGTAFHLIDLHANLIANVKADPAEGSHQREGSTVQMEDVRKDVCP